MDIFLGTPCISSGKSVACKFIPALDFVFISCILATGPPETIPILSTNPALTSSKEVLVTFVIFLMEQYFLQ